MKTLTRRDGVSWRNGRESSVVRSFFSGSREIVCVIGDLNNCQNPERGGLDALESSNLTKREPEVGRATPFGPTQPALTGGSGASDPGSLFSATHTLPEALFFLDPPLTARTIPGGNCR
jgi:hypothetical protein